MPISPAIRGAGFVFVVQLIAWYIIVPYIFSGQSKNVQYAIIVGIALFAAVNTYRMVGGVAAEQARRKAAAEAELAAARAIVARGPKAAGYYEASQTVVRGVTY